MRNGNTHMDDATILVPRSSDPNLNLVAEKNKLIESLETRSVFSNSISVDAAVQYNDDAPIISIVNPIIWAFLNYLSESEVEVDLMKEEMKNLIHQIPIAGQRLNIDKEKVNAVQYIICTVIDELIIVHFSKNKMKFMKDSLLEYFFKESYGGEKFYNYTEKYSQGYELDVGVLELVFICLSLGFQGKYRLMDDGESQVVLLKQKLHRIMLSNAHPVEYVPIKDRNFQSEILPNGNTKLLILSIMFGICTLAGLTFLFKFTLSEQVDQLISDINLFENIN